MLKGQGRVRKKLGGNRRHYRAAVWVEERVEDRKAGGRWAGRGELPCSRGAMEPNPTAVHAYYHKWNNGELGALLRLLSPQPMSHRARGITITSNVNYKSQINWKSDRNHLFFTTASAMLPPHSLWIKESQPRGLSFHSHQNTACRFFFLFLTCWVRASSEAVCLITPTSMNPLVVIMSSFFQTAAVKSCHDMKWY